jgi:hypothetical protein
VTNSTTGFEERVRSWAVECRTVMAQGGPTEHGERARQDSNL